MTQINSHRMVVTIEAGAVTENKNWEQESTGTRRSRKAPWQRDLEAGGLGRNTSSQGAGEASQAGGKPVGGQRDQSPGVKRQFTGRMQGPGRGGERDSVLLGTKRRKRSNRVRRAERIWRWKATMRNLGFLFIAMGLYQGKRGCCCQHPRRDDVFRGGI